MRHGARGFSMVELMVAITLGLITTAAVISVFVGSNAAYQATAGVGALTDGGRFAMNFIQNNVREAGNIACTEVLLNPLDNDPIDSPIQPILLNGYAGSLAYDYRFGVAGYEALGTAPNGNFAVNTSPTVDSAPGDWVNGLDPTFTAGGLTPLPGQAVAPTQVKGSDILVLRSTLQATPSYLTLNAALGATTFTVNNSTGLAVGQIAAASDCTKALVFQITNIAPVGAGQVSISMSGAGLTPGNVAGATVQLPFTQGALLAPLTTTVYYIGKGSDGDSALKRLDLNGPQGAGVFSDEELVPDIENMQILYGVESTPGTLVPGQYVTADQVPNVVMSNGANADFRNVVSIKVALLAASPPSGGTGPVAAHGPYQVLGTTITVPNDNRERQVFELTIALRNQTT